jgi:hypothetical protein
MYENINDSRNSPEYSSPEVKTIEFQTNEPIDLGLKENIERINNQKWKMNSLSSMQKYFQEKKEIIDSDIEEWIELGCKPIEDDCFKRTIKIVSDILYELWNNDIKMELPEILPCQDGTININWEVESYNLLINIPTNSDELIDFYGKNFSDNSKNIIGKFSFEMLNEVIIKWIMKTHPLG